MTYRQHIIESITNQVKSSADIDITGVVTIRIEFDPVHSILYGIFSTSAHGNIKVYSKSYLSYLRYNRKSLEDEDQIKQNYNWSTNYAGLIDSFANIEYTKYQHEKILEGFIYSEKINKFEFLPNVICNTSDFIVFDHPSTNPEWLNIENSLKLFTTRVPPVADRIKQQLGILPGHLLDHSLWKQILKDLHVLWCDTVDDSGYIFNKTVGLDQLDSSDISNGFTASNFYAIVLNNNHRTDINTLTDYKREYTDITLDLPAPGVTVTDSIENEFDDYFYYNKKTKKWIFTGIECLSFEPKTRLYFSQQESLDITEVGDLICNSNHSDIIYYTLNGELNIFTIE